MGSQADKTELVNVMTLRKIVGSLAFLLPVVVSLGVIVLCKDFTLQDSISDYYYTIMRNYFVGTLCAVALVLFSYKGYDDKDDRFGDIAALCALLVAFFPTTPEHPIDYPFLSSGTVGIIHLSAAALLFWILSHFSLKLFIKTKDPNNMSDRKKLRNKVYVSCGITIRVCLGLLLIYFLIMHYDYLGWGEAIQKFKLVYIFEFIMLWAFGFSWLVKGEIIWSDKE
ncbi:MAG: hypothetical protein RLN81_09380 [Balneolaceae bacterium]